MLTLPQIVKAGHAVAAFFFLNATADESRRYAQAMQILEFGMPSVEPIEVQPRKDYPRSAAYYTTADFQSIIVEHMLPYFESFGRTQFTGSDAKKWMERNLEFTSEDLEVTGGQRERWRGLLSQALRGVAVSGRVYKKPGQTRTYYFSN